MARPKAEMSNPERGAATRQQILDAVVPLIARHGSRGVALNSLAAAAGLSKTGLMHHFPQKNALLNAVLDVRDAADGFPRPWGADTGIEMLDHIVEGVKRWRSQPELVGVFTVLLIENLNVGDPLHERLASRAAQVRALYVDAIEEGKKQGEISPGLDSSLAASEVIAFLNGLETYWLLDPELPAETMAEDWRAATRARWAMDIPAAIPSSFTVGLHR